MSDCPWGRKFLDSTRMGELCSQSRAVNVPPVAAARPLSPKTTRYCWSTYCHVTWLLSLLRILPVPGPSTTAYVRHHFRHCRVDQQYPTGYCWRTKKCRSLCVIHTFFEGKKAGETYARKSGRGTLKEVRQQYPTVFCDSALLSQHNAFGLHCGGWVVDCRSRQGYNVFVAIVRCER
jgi:hypothetical protein